jgi:hypothetical protein
LKAKKSKYVKILSLRSEAIFLEDIIKTRTRFSRPGLWIIALERQNGMVSMVFLETTKRNDEHGTVGENKKEW